MASHSSPLAWKIPWMEEPGRLQSMGSLGVGHDWATSLSLVTFLHGEGNGSPLQWSCLENPRDGGAWWAAVYGVAQSRRRLKWLSSSSSSISVSYNCVKSKEWRNQCVSAPTSQGTAYYREVYSKCILLCVKVEHFFFPLESDFSEGWNDASWREGSHPMHSEVWDTAS